MGDLELQKELFRAAEEAYGATVHAVDGNHAFALGVAINAVLRTLIKRGLVREEDL